MVCDSSFEVIHPIVTIKLKKIDTCFKHNYVFKGQDISYMYTFRP